VPCMLSAAKRKLSLTEAFNDVVKAQQNIFRAVPYQLHSRANARGVGQLRALR
jgi:hypothetical protein